MANPYKKDISIIYHFPLVDIPDYISQTGFLFKKKRLSSYEGLYVMCVKFLPMRSYPTTRYTALLVSSVSYFLPSSSCRLVPFAIAGQVPFFLFFPTHFSPKFGETVHLERCRSVASTQTKWITCRTSFGER